MLTVQCIRRHRTHTRFCERVLNMFTQRVSTQTIVTSQWVREPAPIVKTRMFEALTGLLILIKNFRAISKHQISVTKSATQSGKLTISHLESVHRHKCRHTPPYITIPPGPNRYDRAVRRRVPPCPLQFSRNSLLQIL